MKKDIHIKFVDFWPGFTPKDNFLTNILTEKYNVIISDNPTYLFFSMFGYENLDYNCVKIFFTGENNTPNFDAADYAIGFSYISFQDRYIRIPLYVLYCDLESLRLIKDVDREQLLNRKFCSFVFSNNYCADSARIDFYHILSKYKKIDAGGALFNNVGGKVPDKLEFVKNYKFNIAFENSLFDGYTTEKLVEPMRVNSLPIYWGNPSVAKDFNTKSFINAADFETLQELADYVAYLDNNDEAYIEKLSQPRLTEESPLDWKERLSDFLCHIVDQEVAKAKRVPLFGYTSFCINRQKELVRENNLFNKNRRLFKYIFRILKFWNKIKS